MAATIISNYDLFVGWYGCYNSILTDQDKEDYQLLKNPDIQYILKVMGACANGFLLPWMKEFSKLNQLSEYQSYVNKQREIITNLLNNSTLCEEWFDDKLKGTSAIHQLMEQESILPSPIGNESMPKMFEERKKEYQQLYLNAILEVFEKHDSKIIGAEVNSGEDRLLKTTNRSGERLFSLLKRLLDDNQNMRSEIITAIAKIRSVNEDTTSLLADYSSKYGLQRKAYQILENAPTRASFKQKALQKMKKQKEKQDGVNFRKQQSEEQLQQILPYLLAQGIQQPITVDKMKLFLKSKQELIKHKNLPNIHLVLGTVREETIKSIQTWIEYEKRLSTQSIPPPTPPIPPPIPPPTPPIPPPTPPMAPPSSPMPVPTPLILPTSSISPMQEVQPNEDINRKRKSSGKTSNIIPPGRENVEKRSRKPNKSLQDFVS
jgi:hypothetical protein